MKDSEKEEKQSLRKTIRNRKNAFLGTDGCGKETEAIWNRVMKLNEFQTADRVLLYCSMPDEVDTSAFIEMFKDKKRLVVPLVEGEHILLKEYVAEKMHPGYRGILEPDPQLPDISPEDIQFALIPGVAFGKNLMRMGRGGGFYDRLLPQLKCPKAGVAFSFQIVDALPAEEWDCPVDLIVSPGGIIR